MRVLVTGNLGYVGSVLTSHLHATFPTWELAGIDAGFFRECTSIKDGGKDYMRQKTTDIRDVCLSDLEGIDAVVHLAGVSNDAIGGEFTRATRQINTEASVNLAQMARRVGVHQFIFASSCSIYGSGADSARAENGALDPLTAYALSKVETESALRDLAGPDFVVTCLRFATACGTSPRLRLDLVMNDFVASALQTGLIEVLSDGSPWRPLIHTRDMARAVEWALIRGGADFLAINVGSNAWMWQVGDLAERVAEVLGKVQVRINSAASPDRRSYQVDFSLFENLAPNHLPAMNFDRAVRELRDQIAQLPLPSGSFRQSKFIRLNQLRSLKQRGILDELLRVAGR